VFYKPNFCCDCGERIEKENRKWWQSRRFCDECAVHLDKLNNRIFKYVGVFVVLTGIGGFIGASSFSSKKPPVVVSQNQSIASAPQQIKTTQSPPTNQSQPNAKSPVQPQDKPPAQTLAAVQPTPDFTQETAYFCGARTQKGTPCSRRMRGFKRCFQHIGKPAMLAEDKLKITQ
jgi:hypothetical protein